MREKTIRSHACLAWILMMTTPYQHNPDSSAPHNPNSGRSGESAGGGEGSGGGGGVAGW